MWIFFFSEHRVAVCMAKLIDDRMAAVKDSWVLTGRVWHNARSDTKFSGFAELQKISLNIGNNDAILNDICNFLHLPRGYFCISLWFDFSWARLGSWWETNQSRNLAMEEVLHINISGCGVLNFQLKTVTVLPEFQWLDYLKVKDSGIWTEGLRR